MRKEEQTDVLVAGAGPVGMLTAILLAEQGVEVMIVDQEVRRAARSYACALHPRTLQLLAEAGLAGPLIESGQRIEGMAIYERQNKVGELKFNQLPGEYPYLLVLPQNQLEGALEERLRRHDKITVRWNHRLSGLAEIEGRLMASIDKLAETATGYMVPDWDWTVERTIQTRAYFVVGADGLRSRVRQALGIGWETAGAPELYEVFEVECEHDPGHEVTLVLEGDLASVMWPLGNRRCRWGFQYPNPPADEERPEKDRGYAQVVHEHDAVTERLQELLKTRAPAFKAGVREVLWSSQVPFQPRVAEVFGRGGCWLAGDAAHQTGPVGMQSMNVGLFEARELAGLLRGLMFREAGPEALAAYDAGRRAEWRQLLGLAGRVVPGPSAPAWARQHANRLRASLPGAGEELRRLAAQIGLVLEP